MLKFSKAQQRGVTLVEMIIAIVIISIAAVALLQGLGQQTRNNVDPMIQSQAQMLARQYLAEVSTKSFFDPSGDPRLDPNLSEAEVNNAISDQSESSNANRALWNNLYEYDGYSSAIYELNGTTPVSGLSGYSVAIDIDISNGLALGTLSNSATCPPVIALIEVVVTDPRNQQTKLSGYRTAYWDPTDYFSGGC
ncbi:prepilin-type N-terminal cleavage/methylation domain-containing protein [Reinekea marinisedimentorum]|uniref:Prepilin-type N-terminal cleavage/methylation domain-containing protein n=1 Tax=Reinekea marinisedimentorum TaxID=230495 RepID=A0A4R3I6D7_9GAMM|nr:prepilin-type N-terminal cleavage/methylation domain-containing protein [Reinekea marinisedimentorum]TCS41645.1 prepilin-type N-terminal cleavage/methylation domain-containing protein [Reinekea marinisedimentorum]